MFTVTDFIRILLKYHSSSQVCYNIFMCFSSSKMCSVLLCHTKHYWTSWLLPSVLRSTVSWMADRAFGLINLLMSNTQNFPMEHFGDRPAVNVEELVV